MKALVIGAVMILFSQVARSQQVRFGIDPGNGRVRWGWFR